MKYIIAVDIGGTTFNSGLFSESLKFIDITPIDKIRNYKNRKDITNAIFNQIYYLIGNNKTDKDDIICIGVASP